MQTATELCEREGCTHPVQSIAGHRKRKYCSDACRQQDYRKRKAETSAHLLEERIAELEDQVHALQAQLNFEYRLHTDTQVRHFKSWLRRRPQPRDSDFTKRFLADGRFPTHASRALYEAKLRANDYTTEDIHLFRDLWLTMILEQ